MGVVGTQTGNTGNAGKKTREMQGMLVQKVKRNVSAKKSPTQN